MSFDALAWAARQNTGSSGTKLVLLGLAECADRQNALAFPSVSALVEFSSLDRKSVIANLDRLQEAGLISDTGRRCGRTGQIKVYQLNLESVPKTEPSQKRNSSEIPAKSPKNGTRNKSEPLNSEAKASSSVGKHLLPSDWTPPAIADLPPMARACAERWTEASYLTEAEAFVLYWRAERKLKSDWEATWANRVIARSSAVMRDQKFGNAPPAIPKPAKPMNAEEQRAYAERYIAKLESEGRKSEAEEARRRYAVSVGEVVHKIIRAA